MIILAPTPMLLFFPLLFAVCPNMSHQDKIASQLSLLIVLIVCCWISYQQWNVISCTCDYKTFLLLIWLLCSQMPDIFHHDVLDKVWNPLSNVMNIKLVTLHLKYDSLGILCRWWNGGTNPQKKGCQHQLFIPRLLHLHLRRWLKYHGLVLQWRHHI